MCRALSFSKTIKGRRNTAYLLYSLLPSVPIFVFLIFGLLIVNAYLKYGLSPSVIHDVKFYVAMSVFMVVGMWMFFVYHYICLTYFTIRFPVACGHRMKTFSGKSSRTLQDILLIIDTDAEDLKVATHRVLYFFDVLKTALENKMTPTTTFKYIFAGSVPERYGIPSWNRIKSKTLSFLGILKADLDAMLCFQSIEAYFNRRPTGSGILIEPLIPSGIGFLGYAKLTSMTTDTTESVFSSKDVIKQAERAVGTTEIKRRPRWVEIKITKPAIRLYIDYCVADITLCIKCREWPTLSDWPTRQRCWPSPDDARRIVSLGCHLVPKPAPSDKEQTSWRFSFSVAEVELSKLVPKTARKCFLALRVIIKKHLQPVYPDLKSYHIKTIFLNTLERTPTNLWVDENIEQCFLILLKEVYDALLHGRCLHHWFRSINLFGNIGDPIALQAVIKKVQRIGENPAPFICDDGCCCLSPCCTRLRLYDFPELTKIDSYDEVVPIDFINLQVNDRIDHFASYDNPSALTATLPSELDAEHPTSSSSSADHKEPFQGWSVRSVVVSIHSPGRQPTYERDDRQQTRDHDERQPLL